MDRLQQELDDFPTALLAQAVALYGAGRTNEAERIGYDVLAREPANVGALQLVGVIALANARAAAAEELFRRAIAIDPNLPTAHSNRAAALHRLERYSEALESADRALALRPDLLWARLNRGAALRDLKRPEEALDEYDRVLAQAPRTVEAHQNRAALLHEMTQPEQALAAYERALTLDPSNIDVLSGRGSVLHDLGRFDDAIGSYRRALELAPMPDRSTTFGMSLLYLLRGDLQTGWELFDYRKQPGPGDERTDWPFPLWTGNAPLEGKTLFTYWEQGLGDTLQFSRYARLAAEQGARVVFAAQDVLHELLGSLHPNVEIIGQDRLPRSADWRCPLLSLPRAFGTTVDTIPANVPYLRADPQRVESWRARIGSEGFRIGICWQGNPKGKVDVGRSFPVSLFQPVGQLQGVRLISLQKGPGCEQLDRLPSGMRVERLGESFDAGPGAFLDAAAVIAVLDLVITCDTAIAHLAGALAKPTWLLLQAVPEWRWLLERRDSPWYPSLRLFRQERSGEWPAVIAAVCEELAALLSPRA